MDINKGEILETSYHSYPKIYALGHAAIADLFDGIVLVEEKIDGSQFSFGMIEGELRCRSKGKQIDLDAPDKMFAAAIGVIKGLQHKLHPGWTYRAEYLQRPGHNALTYNRIPNNHLMIFDVNIGLESYLNSEDKECEATRLGFECVPVISVGAISNPEEIREFLERESVLGGPNVEGVVIKNYTQFGRDKKVLMGKYVSEKFKEIHTKKWGESNPTGKDIIASLASGLRTDARWEKAIQHLTESGSLENSPRDIGKIIAEIKSDTQSECADLIKEQLFAWAWPTIQRQIVKGFPEFYKNKLLDSAFVDQDEEI